MRPFPRVHFVSMAVVLTVLALAQPDHADTITQSVSGCSGCKGYAFQATLQSLGSNNYSLSYTIANVSGSAAYAQTSALVPFQFGNTISSVGNFSVTKGQTNATGAYNLFGGKSTQWSNVGLCSFNFSDSLCITPSGLGPPSSINKGQSLTFSFDFNCANCTQLKNWDFLAYGTCATGSSICYAIAADGTPSAPTRVPEPSVLTLLASEIAFVACIVLVFHTKIRNRVSHRWENLFRLQRG